MSLRYAIGTPGEPWGPDELAQWRAQASIQRSYQDLVVGPVYTLSERYRVHNYGALSHDPLRYGLFALETASPSSENPWVLITGGVHGYETSGVLGALAFLETHAGLYEDRFNFLVAPCISPWGFETINRWNIESLDPNRSFKEDGLCEEAALFIALLNERNLSFEMHIDLHETTDTDASEFRPALSAKLGQPPEPTEIPDGFYLVGDTDNPQPAFQRAIIEAVSQVTHIADSDQDGRLLGDKAAQQGVVNYPVKSMGLCAGLTQARFTTTTEVYPDSPRATPQQCIEAQVCAIDAALRYIATA